MDVDEPLPNRHTARLISFDYASCGPYFVTVCTQGRACVLGSVVEQEVVPTTVGRIIEKCWRDIPRHFPTVGIDSHVVMPNHVHGLIVLNESDGATRAPTLGQVVRAFKARSSIEIRRQWTPANGPIWQRNYYERVVRDDEELNRIRQYIADNPKNWDTDQENPAAFA